MGPTRLPSGLLAERSWASGIPHKADKGLPSCVGGQLGAICTPDQPQFRTEAVVSRASTTRYIDV